MPSRRAPAGPHSKIPGRRARAGTTTDVSAPVRVFISYSHRDDAARDRLDVHMAQLKREGVSVFFDGDMIAGTELDPRIRRELRLAEIFVALASPAYLHSRYCFEIEYGYALRKAKRGKVHLVVALVEECQWRHTRMSRYKLLPRDGKPVSKWRPYGEAFEDIVNGLRGVVKAVRAERLPQAHKPAAAAAPKVRGRKAPADKRVRAANGATPKRKPKSASPPKAATTASTRPIKPRTSPRKPAPTKPRDASSRGRNA